LSFIEELKRRNVFRVGLAYVLLGWALLQGADFTLDLIGAPEWVIRAIAVVVTIGLPIALFFAWAFELTPEGIKRESEVDRSASVTPQTGRKLDRAIILLLALVVSWFLLDEFYLEPRETAQPANAQQAPPGTQNDAASTTRSVAVLPFRNMSSGADDGFFADGLTEEILNSLAQVPELAVTSRTSAFYFKDRDLPIRDIAEQLGVEHVVEGSVRRSGDRLRVTAQLIRVSDDTHLWSETYDRTDADAIAVQEEIAQRIAETLGVFLDDTTLALMRSAGLRDVTAFIEYQKGRDLHDKAHGNDEMLRLLAEGNVHLKNALDIQPTFSPAWLYYSDYATHVLLDSATGEMNPPATEDELREALGEARMAFQQAARHTVDPGARAAAELDMAIFNGDSTSWRPLIEQVVTSETCSTSIWHQLVGYLPEFNERFTNNVVRLNACDPLTVRYRAMIQLNRVWAGQADRALEEGGQGETDSSEFEVMGTLRALVALKRFEEAGAVAAIDSESVQARAHEQVLIAAAQGDLAEVERIRQSLDEFSQPNDWLRLTQAAWLGDRDTANALAAKLDAKPLGHLALMITVYWCACGSPFDLEAAPNFAEIWEAAGQPWPLQSPIDLPLKDW
jgi:TolB-like protein